LIRWFADLPIERKLRVVILVPAIAVFGVAMAAHIAMNLLHSRNDLQWSAARVARVTGASTIDALRLGDAPAALKAMSGLRDEWLVSDAEILAADGRRLATYRRVQNEAHLEPAAAQNALASPPAAPLVDPQHPQLDFQGSQIHVSAAVVRNGTVAGFVRILVPFDVLYGDRRRSGDGALARRATATTNLGTHRQFGAHHAEGLFRRRLQSARRTQFPR